MKSHSKLTKVNPGTAMKQNLIRPGSRHGDRRRGERNGSQDTDQQISRDAIVVLDGKSSEESLADDHAINYQVKGPSGRRFMAKRTSMKKEQVLDSSK